MRSHEFYFGAVGILQKDQKYLMIMHNSGLAFPGGAYKQGESPAQTSARETFEESNKFVYSSGFVGGYIFRTRLEHNLIEFAYQLQTMLDWSTMQLSDSSCGNVWVDEFNARNLRTGHVAITEVSDLQHTVYNTDFIWKLDYRDLRNPFRIHEHGNPTQIFLGAIVNYDGRLVVPGPFRFSEFITAQYEIGKQPYDIIERETSETLGVPAIIDNLLFIVIHIEEKLNIIELQYLASVNSHPADSLLLSLDDITLTSGYFPKDLSRFHNECLAKNVLENRAQRFPKNLIKYVSI